MTFHSYSVSVVNVSFKITYSLYYCTGMYTPVGFFKKANHYNNFDCHTLGNANPVIGNSEIVAESDYDVIKRAAILDFNTNLLCFIIAIIVGRFQILGIKMFKMISAVYSHLKNG